MWWVYILIFVAIIYIYSYYKLPKELILLQTSLSRFQFDMLREKQPIVIHDRLPNLDAIHRLWFQTNRVSHTKYPENNPWQRNRYKYLVLHPKKDCEIMVVLGNTNLLEDGAPDPETAMPVVLQMKSDQMVILPFRSLWMSSASDIHAIGVHDWITYFLP
jgi:hypothetical protein